MKNSNNYLIPDILAAFKEATTVYKSNFLIPHKDKFIPLATDKIACFYSENKMVKIFTFDQQTYNVDSSLEDLFMKLNPSKFFRANRQFIVSHKAIKDISVWFGSKLSINLTVPVPEKIIVSKARVPEFKNWYTE
jgi:two-component system LytT family response regulator